MNRMILLGGDRSRSLHFAGRRKELAALHERFRYLVSEQDPEDGLVLIDGIQGIGKTGLQHSRQVLQDPLQTTDERPSPAISRFSTFTLAMLSHEDSVEAVQQSVLKASNRALPAELAERIAGVCEGFPQHLHGYVQAAVYAAQTFGTLDAGDAKQWLMEQGDEARRTYYEGRLASFSPDEGIALCQIAAIARERDGHVPWREAAEATDAADTDATGRQLLTAAIQKGVVSLAEGSTDLVFPIPSLMNHLASRLGQPG